MYDYICKHNTWCINCVNNVNTFIYMFIDKIHFHPGETITWFQALTLSSFHFTCLSNNSGDVRYLIGFFRLQLRQPNGEAYLHLQFLFLHFCHQLLDIRVPGLQLRFQLNQILSGCLSDLFHRYKSVQPSICKLIGLNKN